MTYSTAFPPGDDASEEEIDDYWAWYDHMEAKGKDFDYDL